MQDQITSVFVYGSLRSDFPNSSYHYISNSFDFVGAAKVKGVLYAGEFPAAIATAEERFVRGELYRLKNGEDFSKAIHRLDEYEGCNEKEGDLSLYKRELVSVACNNLNVKAWIYWYNRKIETEILIPSGDIIDFLEINSK